MSRKLDFAASLRPEPAGLAAIGDADPNERIALTIYFKRRKPHRCDPGSAADLARLSVSTTRRQLAAERARTHRRAAERIAAFANARGLTVRYVD
jgi:kumamolisin